jgi:hypothetical protein
MVSAVSEQDVVDQATQLGTQGWELVSVVRVTGSPAWRAFFKRATKRMIGALKQMEAGRSAAEVGRERSA